MPNVTTVSADFTVKSGQWLVVVVLVIKTVPGLGGGLEKKKKREPFWTLALDTLWHCRLQKKSCPVSAQWWLSLFSRFL